MNHKIGQPGVPRNGYFSWNFRDRIESDRHWLQTGRRSVGMCQSPATTSTPPSDDLAIADQVQQFALVHALGTTAIPDGIRRMGESPETTLARLGNGLGQKRDTEGTARRRPRRNLDATIWQSVLKTSHDGAVVAYAPLERDRAFQSLSPHDGTEVVAHERVA